MDSAAVTEAIAAAKYNEAVVIQSSTNATETATNLSECTASSITKSEVVLVAKLDKENGGILWAPLESETGSSSSLLVDDRGTGNSQDNKNDGSERGAVQDDDDPALVRHFRTKRWIMPMLNDTVRNESYERAIRGACIAARELATSKLLPQVPNCDGGTEIPAGSRAENEGGSTAKVGSYDDEDQPIALRALDIGAGTGLLAMLVARHSPLPVHVVSVEMASPMARLARRIVKSNNLQDMITIIEGHSCDSSFTPFDSVDVRGEVQSPCKANICTSELLESGLLGEVGRFIRLDLVSIEGILPSLRDAFDRHLGESAVVVPCRARVFAQIVAGSFVSHYRGPLVKPGIKLTLATSQDPADVFLDCASVVPMHSEALRAMEVRPLSQPSQVLEFDFTSGSSIPPPSGRSKSITVDPSASGMATGVVFWWEIDLWEGITYSTEPGSKWQDHWQQCLFVLGTDQECPQLKQGEKCILDCFHDDTKIGFAVKSDKDHPGHNKRQKRSHTKVKHRIEDSSHFSSTLSHTYGHRKDCSPERCLQLNNHERLTSIQSAIAATIAAKGDRCSVLDLSDFSLCAIVAANSGAQHVTSVESSSGGIPLLSARVAQLANGLNDNSKFQIINAYPEQLTPAEVFGGQADVVVAEPYYEKLEGWHLHEALNLYHTIRALKNRKLISHDAFAVPAYARVMACAIESDNLASAYSGVDSQLCGFQHDLVNGFGNRFHEYDLSIPLWQYSYKKLTDDFELAQISFCNNKYTGIRQDKGWSKSIISSSGTCHAMIVWVEYGMCQKTGSYNPRDDDRTALTISTASRCHRQLVRMLPNKLTVQTNDVFCCRISFEQQSQGEDYTFAIKVETS